MKSAKRKKQIGVPTAVILMAITFLFGVMSFKLYSDPTILQALEGLGQQE